MIAGLENPLHLLMIAVIVLLLFGAKRLPEVGRSLGTGMREFKSGILGQHSADVDPVTTARSQSPKQV
jgi:sec-independent protein translocase protein TatA